MGIVNLLGASEINVQESWGFLPAPALSGRSLAHPIGAAHGPFAGLRGRGVSAHSGRADLPPALNQGRGVTRGSAVGQLGLAPSTYLPVFQQLLPAGKAWTRDSDAELTALLEALSYESMYVDLRSQLLLKEADPSQANELLPDWLRITGLSGDASLTTPTLQQQAVCAKLAARGGCSIPFLTAVALQLGYTITIGETKPFVAGSNCGDSLSQGSWVFYWTVTTAHGANDAFLQSILQALTQLHTMVAFIFT